MEKVFNALIPLPNNMVQDFDAWWVIVGLPNQMQNFCWFNRWPACWTKYAGEEVLATAGCNAMNITLLNRIELAIVPISEFRELNPLRWS